MKYSKVFVSDVHLGTSVCRSKNFLNFLKKIDTKELVLVGDIIDISYMKKRPSTWNEDSINCIHEMINLLKNGTKITYVLGNHEKELRRYINFTHGNLHLCNEYSFIDEKGQRILCTHGDGKSQFLKDGWEQNIFNSAYNMMTPLSIWAKRMFNFSILSSIKKTEKGKQFIDKYETDIVGYTKSLKKYDGVICGHIHHAHIKAFKNLVYMCCGDWVETCSAIVEFDGTYQIKYY
jgi:UDP-2,3-diacylglucosamine pyrophosphatase LpxH